MLFLILKSQLGLFVNVPVHVAAHVRKDGTRVADHMALRKKKVGDEHEAHQHALFAAEEPKGDAAAGPKIKAKLRAFLTKHGGPARMSRMLAEMTAEQRGKLLDAMALAGGVTVAEVQQVLSSSAPAQAPAAETPQADLFNQPEEAHKPDVPEPAQAPEEASPAPAPEDGGQAGRGIPPGVRDELQRLVDRLKGIRQRVDEAAGLDVRFGSNGRYEADALANVARELAGPTARLQRLRDVAKQKGIDLEPTLAQMGLPSFEPSAGARGWMDGGTKQAPAPAAAPAPAPAPEPTPTREAPQAEKPKFLPMESPAKMFRSVSPEEWEAIKQSGKITGGANSFNVFDPRKHVFFGPAMTSKVVHQGEDVTRRAEYQIQQGEHGKRFAELQATVKGIGEQIEQQRAKLKLDGKTETGINWDPKIKRLRAKLAEADKAIGALRDEARTAISARIKQLRAEDEARGYTSVVLETRPVDGGRRFTGENSGMGDEDEFGFDPGHVKLQDVVKVRYVRNGEVVREEAGPGAQEAAAPAQAEQGPREGDTKVENGVTYTLHRGRWRREDTDEEIEDRRVSAVASDVAAVIFQESRERDFAPSEIPQAIDFNADDAKIDRAKLRAEVMKVLHAGKFDISGGRLQQIERALSKSPAVAKPPTATPDRAAIVNTGDKLADYWSNSAGASIERDVKAGRVRTVDLTGTAPAPHPATQAPAPVAPFGVPAGTTKAARRDINARVAALVAAGEVDKDLMRQYSGNGGCGDSLNEFYTDPGVAAGMWSVVRRLGITSGTAFEPSCATGVFIHTAPEGFKVTGVEMDPISNACALALHGDRHEIAPPSSLERFATQDTRQFKVVIGNPPYGPRGSLLSHDKSDLAKAEEYFADTCLDKCEPGGLVGLVVPTGIMDSENGRKLRERLLRKGEFLGAQRLPNTAFEASHTAVTTDVVWFRKRPNDVAGALGTVDKATLKHLGVWDDEYLSGNYFTGRGAGNILGTMEAGWRAKAGMGNDITVEGSMDGVADRVSSFEPHPVGKSPTMQDVLAALEGDEKATARALGGAAMPAYSKSKVGDTKTEDGVTYILQGDPPRWHRVDEFVASRPAVVDAVPLAEQIDRAVAGLPVDKGQLKSDVEAWVARYGIPAKHGDLALAAKADKRLHRLIGAVSNDGTLSDVVVGRDAKKIEGSLETIAQALALKSRGNGSLLQQAMQGDGFSPEDLAEASGRDVESVTDELHASSAYAYLSGGKWTTMAQYLTGDLWPKLDAVRGLMTHPDVPPELRGKYEEQARRLEAAIDPKSLDDVEFHLNSGFIPPELIAAWLNWRNHDSPEANEWTKKLDRVSVTFGEGVYNIEGGTSYGADALLAKYLNRTGVRKDDLPQVDAMNESFRAWLLTSEHRDRVEDIYNRKFRGFSAPKWSDEPFEVPGMAAADLNRYHFPSLRRALAQGKGIIAADVGLGKTVRGLMLARMLKMTGQAKRPTFVVPKSVLANWVAESQKWFPGSRVLVIGETYTKDKDGKLKSRADTAAERARKYQELTQNDYDFVFISAPTFNELDLNPDLKSKYVADNFWERRGKSLAEAKDKKIKRAKEAFDQNVAGREFHKRADSIHFDQLGIDALIMDEAHAYKNLHAAKQRFGESPKFLGGQGQSNRAFDFDLKARHLRDSNGGKGIFSLTATPTKNSPLEIYSMLSPIAPEEFERLGIRNSEEFIDRFCVFKDEQLMMGLDGKLERGLAVVGFKNLGELRAVMDKYIDRTTAADVGLELPKRDDAIHMVDMDVMQRAKYGELRAMLKEAGEKDAEGDSHVFSIMDKMAKTAQDLELLDPDAYAGHESPKYKEAAKHIKAGTANGGQVVFCEAVDSHEKIASMLVKAGIPRDQIAILNGKTASTSAKRQNISDDFNAGKIKVVIGNKTMEEGVNLQKSTADIHHLDTPWDPATVQQRNGRGLRQGNRNGTIRIHTYLSRGTFDGVRYQSMSAKRDWMDMLWKGGDKVENLAAQGGMSREDMLVAMSEDPDAEREKLQNDKVAEAARHEAGKKADAAEAFVRFQTLKRSYGALKNKDTQAGLRLRANIEKAKTSLANNRFFGARAALDANEEVVLHPQTHDMLTRDVGLEVDEKDGSKSKWVITAADPIKGEVSMRRYADTAGGRAVTVPLEKLAAGTRTFKFDGKAEGEEVRQHLESAAAAAMDSVEKLEDVRKMPANVIEANYDLLQRRLKDADKAYKLGGNYGDIPMVNKATGKVEAVSHYSTKDKHETHDFALPIPAHREAAIQQWIDERRGAKIGSRYVDKPGRRKDQVRKLSREHAGSSYANKHVNPMRSVLNEMDGRKGAYGQSDDPSIAEAKARLEREQMKAIRRAPTFRDALNAAMPLASVGDDRVTHSPRVLALLWAKAKRSGALSAKLLNHAAGSSRYLEHTSEAYGGGDAHSKTVQQALMAMAAAGRKSGGLVPAMSRSVDASLNPGAPQQHREHIGALVDMANGFEHDTETRLDAAREALRVAEKIGAGDVPKVNFLGGSRAGTGYFYGSNEDAKPMRDYLKIKIADLENRRKIEAAKADESAMKEAA